jgi:uncharacterized protein YjiK
MIKRNTILFLLFVSVVASSVACNENKRGTALSSHVYDIENPMKLVLKDDLMEISGIAFYAKDTSVFAISDENGYLYKIHMTNKYLVEKWRFDKTHDFEDVCFIDSTFYVLESNGNIHTLQFSPKGDTIYTRKNEFAGKKDEFESLYYDSTKKQLILLCKDCKEDKKNFLSAFSFDPQTGNYGTAFTIDVDAIARKIGEEKMKFKPSAATVNPVTGDVWIISAINNIIVVTDNNGVLKNVYPINSGIFTQPEGITFTPWGDLLISNEAGDKYNAPTIFIFKPKKNS